MASGEVRVAREEQVFRAATQWFHAAAAISAASPGEPGVSPDRGDPREVVPGGLVRRPRTDVLAACDLLVRGSGMTTRRLFSS
jgi:hypothetical protein